MQNTELIDNMTSETVGGAATFHCGYKPPCFRLLGTVSAIIKQYSSSIRSFASFVFTSSVVSAVSLTN